jgi:glycosyltransferase involved in cell wall biosynthesis
MRIVIDMQGAQTTGSHDRGIGRYSLSLARAIICNRGKHEIFLALNGSFSDSIQTIRSEFDNLLPQENILVWTAPKVVHYFDNSNDWRRHSAELLREAFLASLNPDIILVTSLFEGLTDDGVSSIGKLSNAVPTAVIAYDLIPLIYSQRYLNDSMTKLWYEEKTSHLRRANILLTISESSRRDVIALLDINSELCFNVSGAVSEKFQPQKINKKQEKDIRERLGLHKPFVLYTGGIDHRKNQEELISAYAMLPRDLRSDHQLAIVCSIQESSRTALEILAKEKGLGPHELVLTDFVSDDDLMSLYNLCKMFVFPSLYEGFGLPVLEAMACGCAVIGSNTSSIPEVIGRNDVLFDPKSDASIAEKMEQVLKDNTYRLKLKQHGLEQAKLFSWDITAQRAIFAFETFHIKKSNEAPLASKPSRRLKLAYISPLPPERSGISDYSSELLPALSRHYKIDVIIAQDSVSDPWITANCSVHNVDWFRKHAKKYDRVLYQFGNSEFHMHMLNLLEEVPGAVVLHDFFLSGMISHMDIQGYHPGLWSKTLYYSHGYAAIQKRFHTLDLGEVIIQYPCNHEVISGAKGVIVHSEYSRRLANNWYGDSSADDWAVIPHSRTTDTYNKDKARKQLKLSDADFVVCSFGFLGLTKMSHRLLDCWLASDLSQNPNCILVFVGENNYGAYGTELQNKIRQSGLHKRILITGWTDNNLYRHYLAAADLAVQLRTLSRGETSGAMLDCLNFSLPTIVNANGSMAELQDDSVWKLPDEFNDDECARGFMEKARSAKKA